ncbi:hypothetical protein PAEH1_02555 [Paenalcaligenes hominis]|uniref:DUF2514 domain-containing protein n=1 Tax=Paenalcaligenes hominis TaxID=643674 RepID=A0A1U9JY54_9BURK|nr:DUF2514 family protein [Paenalcaligenes hominis]AQS50708.1 hypothetical protein PAEH1_02555 [Paenalcaligenes hominis]
MSIKSGVIGAAVLAALFFGVRIYGNLQYKAGYDMAHKDQQAVVAQAESNARQIEQQSQLEVENVRKYYQDRIDAEAHAAALAQHDNDGLQRDLANASSRAAAEAARAGRALDENARIAAELRNVVGVCSARYTELAQIADGYRSDLEGLQRYVKVLSN